MKTNLDKFVEELRDKLKNHKDYSEDEIIRFIYIALGKKIVLIVYNLVCKLIFTY